MYFVNFGAQVNRNDGKTRLTLRQTKIAANDFMFHFLSVQYVLKLRKKISTK